MKSSCRIAALACGLALLAGCAMTASVQQAQPKMLYDQQWLSATADDLNKSLPKMIDPETRWDRVTPGPGMKLTYAYTMVKQETQKVDIERFITAMHSNLRKSVCSREATQELMKNGVILSYLYRGSDGGFISLIQVSPYCD